MSKQHVKINLGASAGHGTVIEVDGHDIGDAVAGFQVVAGQGRGAVVVLETAPGRSIEFEGPAEVQVYSIQRDRQVILSFLDEINAEELEEQALDGDFSTTPFQAAISVLRQKAGEWDG